jgi:pyrophosphatase PpaX
MTDAALFDWDGTLLDSRRALLDAWHAATESVLDRRFPQSEDDERLIFTLPGRQLFPQLAGSSERGAALAEAFTVAYRDTGRQVRAYPGVPAMLRDLRAEGVRVAVVTSKARERFELDAVHASLDGLVDVAVCSGDTPAHKPDPAPVLHALERLGVAAADAVVVGDTEVDVLAARAAGVAAVGVAWGPLGADGLVEAGAGVIADHPEELTRIISRVSERINT